MFPPNGSYSEVVDLHTMDETYDDMTANPVYVNTTVYMSVADLGFGKEGFQVCGRRPHCRRRQSLLKQPSLGGLEACSPRKFWKYGCFETRFVAFWGM